MFSESPLAHLVIQGAQICTSTRLSRLASLSTPDRFSRLVPFLHIRIISIQNRRTNDILSVGKPIRVEQNKNPGLEEIEKVQKEYIAELTASVIFFSHLNQTQNSWQKRQANLIVISFVLS
jgi:hypothetical protein